MIRHDNMTSSKKYASEKTTLYHFWKGRLRKTAAFAGAARTSLCTLHTNYALRALGEEECTCYVPPRSPNLRRSEEIVCPGKALYGPNFQVINFFSGCLSSSDTADVMNVAGKLEDNNGLHENLRGRVPEEVAD